jgi:acetyl esterase
MTQSLPARRDPGRVRLVTASAMGRIAIPVMARIPDRVKRLLLGRRTVTVDGNTLDTSLQLMLAAQRLSKVSGLVASSDVAVSRTQLNRAGKAFRSPIVVAARNFTIAGPAGAIPVRHYRAADGAPLLVFYHGGGFVVGGLDSHDALCRRISHDAGVHVLSVDYRLAPEHKAPAAADDADAAYRWALEHAGELGADPDKVAVGGDSAGGNLAAVVTQSAHVDGVRLPALQFLIYPVTDFGSATVSKTLFAEGYFLSRADMDWFHGHYLDGADIDGSDPRVAPLLATDLSGLSPALVATGGFDPLRDEGRAYAQALAAAGVPVDWREYGSLIHAFANFFPLGGGSEAAIADLTSALRAHLSR